MRPTRNRKKLMDAKTMSLSQTDRPFVSLEYFPPREASQLPALVRTAQTLASHHPSFQTVTFGAGGSTTDGTFDAVTTLARKTRLPTACHLTCVGITKSELAEFADKLWHHGIRHIVALRGDLPEGLSRDDVSGPDYFSDTPEFIAALKALHPFEISVGAYPEVHPDAKDADADFAFFSRKCAAGADRAITQFFFDNADFYRYRDRVVGAGLDVELVPGILPIVRFKGAFSFATRCGARIPERIKRLYKDVAGDIAAETVLATELARDQVEDLARNGVNHIHVYTLNRVEMADIACRSFLAAHRTVGRSNAVGTRPEQPQPDERRGPRLAI
ncbi:MAG: methylenetetrahydrofolate reductase [Pseudomonadota bacterium]